jgi:HEPN domain-containing protein
LAPYGIWYYGAILDKLVEKLDNALKKIIYSAPDVHEELEVLSELKNVEHFEDIGNDIEELLSVVRGVPLDEDSCKKLYTLALEWRFSFRARIDEFLLVRPELRRLDRAKIIEEMKELPADPRIKEWLQVSNERIRDFKEGCSALIYGLPTAAGFHFMRLCERALRELYAKIAGEEPEKKTWGEILDKLEEYYKNKRKPEILYLLSYLRNMRNKIMHPEGFLSQEEAETLSFYTMDVIRSLKDLLGEVEQKSVKPGQ